MILIDQESRFGKAAASFTLDHSVLSQNQVLVVLIGSEAGALPAGGVKFNGTNLQKLASQTEPTTGFTTVAEVWWMPNPPVGTYALSIAQASATFIQGVALTLSGVGKKTSIPVTATAVSSGTSGTLTASIYPASANSMLLDIMLASSTGTVPTASPDSSQRILGVENSNSPGVSYKIVNPAAQQMAWTWSGGTLNVGTVLAVVALEPSDATSLWEPALDSRNLFEIESTITASTLNKSLGYRPSTFWDNSFLHTIGRITPKAAEGSGVRGKLRLDELRDDFHALTLDSALWSSFTAGSAALFNSPSGMGVNYPASTSSSTDGDITTNNSYDMTNSGAFIHIKSMVAGSAVSSDCNFSIRADANNKVQFQVEGGVLFAQQIVATSQTNLKSVAYNSTDHAWWRIREKNGRTYWETSRDGLNWQAFLDIANPITVTSVTVLLAGVSFGVDSSPGTFAWEYLNVLPQGLWDDFGFRPAQPTYYSSSLYQTIGRLVPFSAAVTPVPAAETEQQTSQILIDKVYQGQSSGGAALTMDINIPSPDAYLIVSGGSVIATGGAWQSVSFNGNGLTKLAGQSTVGADAEIWAYPFPTVGTYPLTVVPTATFGQAYVNAMVILGVDKRSVSVQAASASDAASTSLISTLITPDAPNSLVLNVLSTLNASFAPAPDENQNQIFNATPINANEYVMSGFQIVSAQETIEYNLGAAVNASLVAVAFRPANAISQWFPAIDTKTLDGPVNVSALDSGKTPATGSYGYYPSNFYLNSFLHTIGRGVSYRPVATPPGVGGTFMLMGVG